MLTGKKWKSTDSQFFEEEMAGAMDEIGGILGAQMTKMKNRVNDTKEMMKRMVRRGGGEGRFFPFVLFVIPLEAPFIHPGFAAFF